MKNNYYYNSPIIKIGILIAETKHDGSATGGGAEAADARPEH